MSGYGRPKKRSLATKTIQIRFTNNQNTKLREISEEKDVPIASIVRKAVAKYLEGG